MAKSNLSSQQADTEETMWAPFSETKLNPPKSAPVESTLQDHEITLNVKLLLYENATQPPPGLETSGGDATSKNCILAWNNSVIRKKSCLPIKIARPNLDLNLSNPLSNQTLANSWFSTQPYTTIAPNLPNIDFPFCPFSPVEGADTIKNPHQPQILKQDLGMVYNNTIASLKYAEASWIKIQRGLLANFARFCQSVPDPIKNGVVNKACTTISKVKTDDQKIGKVPQIPFRLRKKQADQSFCLPKFSLKEACFYVETLGKNLGFKKSLLRNRDGGENGTAGCIPPQYPLRPTENQDQTNEFKYGSRFQWRTGNFASCPGR